MPEEGAPEAVCMYGQRNLAATRVVFGVHHAIFDGTALPCKQLSKPFE